MDGKTTIEALEDLAAELEAAGEARRTELLRLVTAYVRIIAQRAPEEFEPQPRFCGTTGEGGGSRPPQEYYDDATGPEAIDIVEPTTSDVRTEPGFYYRWRRVTTQNGLCVGPAGQFYRYQETGTGEYAHYPAWPGNKNVMCELTYTPVEDPGVLAIADLLLAEQTLRAVLDERRTQ